MCREYERLRTSDDVVIALSVPSSRLIVFDNEYCVHRVAGEPATDQMVDVDLHLLQEMWQFGELEGTILEYGMSYRLPRESYR